MADTHLLAWNPNAFPSDNVADIAASVWNGEQEGMNWSVGKIKNIQAGSRFFLIRLGVNPKGIVGAGRIKAVPEEREHYDPALAALGRKLNFVDLEFDELNVVPVISWEELHQGILAKYSWSIRQSGPKLPEDIAKELERLWSDRCGLPPAPMSYGIKEGENYWEGAVVTVTVNRYERDSKARASCLAHYGFECQVCFISLADFFGPEAAELIEVHHVVPISEIRESYAVDPIKDLVPVCPNCHAMIHHGGITRTVGEVQALILEQDELSGSEEVASQESGGRQQNPSDLTILSENSPRSDSDE